MVRVRQHVNPLARKFQETVPLPDWGVIYTQPHQPLHLDLGCARGRFLQQLAPIQPEWNFLGIEIREPLVVEANRWRDERGLGNLHFWFCNLNVMLEPLLRSLPGGGAAGVGATGESSAGESSAGGSSAGGLQRVSIQFPDPWFKQRHQKRRVVQPELVAQLAEYMPSGAEVFLQSDILAVVQEMGDRFQAHPAFVPTHSGWLTENPFPVPTEREIATHRKGQPVYRQLLQRR